MQDCFSDILPEDVPKLSSAMAKVPTTRNSSYARNGFFLSHRLHEDAPIRTEVTGANRQHQKHKIHLDLQE